MGAVRLAELQAAGAEGSRRMTAQQLGLRPIESAVAACLIDGLTQRETAAAIGCGRATVFDAEVKLCRRFGAWKRAGLAAALATIEARLPQQTLNRPLGTGEPPCQP